MKGNTSGWTACNQKDDEEPLPTHDRVKSEDQALLEQEPGRDQSSVQPPEQYIDQNATHSADRQVTRHDQDDGGDLSNEWEPQVKVETAPDGESSQTQEPTPPPDDLAYQLPVPSYIARFTQSLSLVAATALRKANSILNSN